jgi:uncharacterized protein YaiI (UPF0178 family)
MKEEPTIWIDGDACPKAIKEIIFRAAQKWQVPTVLVANKSMRVPDSAVISFVQVEQGADVADFYIAQHAKSCDLVITQDIPLAAEIVDLGAVAIDPRGELFDEENVRERLSVRDYMDHLRGSGVVTGGPAAFGAKDKERFANSFNNELMRKIKK